MEAYTFRTVPGNGVLTLPETYENKLVEVTIREIKSQGIRKRDLLSSVKINTDGLKWTREEANERR